MTHAVILTDRLSLSDTIIRSLEQASWTLTEVTFQSVLVNNQLPSEHAECLLILIDKRFHQKYSSWINSFERVLAMVKKDVPVFILFEERYQDIYSSWLTETTRLFQNLNQFDKRATALKQLIDFAGGGVR